MTELEDIADLEFPRTPMEIATQDTVRTAVVKAAAYVTFALEEADIDHSRGLEAAMVTDSQYRLKENKTPEEYLDLAIQELAHAESEVDDSDYQQELFKIRKTLQSIIE